MNSQKTDLVTVGKNTTDGAQGQSNIKEEPVFEYSEIGWEGNPDELALFILVGGC